MIVAMISVHPPVVHDSRYVFEQGSTSLSLICVACVCFIFMFCSYASDRLYLEGGSAGVTCEDVVNKKTLPQALQEELLRSRGQDVVRDRITALFVRCCS